MRTPEQIISDLREKGERYRYNLAAVRDNPDLSDSAKRRELAAAYSDAASTFKRLEREYRETVEARVSDLRREIFAPPRVGGSDKATSLLLYRDALSRMAGITEPGKLKETLRQADVTGDTPLAKAALLTAYEGHSDLSDMSSVVHEYFERFPSELDKWEELQKAGEAYNELQRLGISFATGTLEPDRPVELGNQPVGVYNADRLGQPPN